MNSVWQSLLWKEWREYRWKMAALSVAILVPPFLFILLLFSQETNSLLHFMQILFGVLFSYGFLAGMFFGMGVAAGENSVGTAGFIQSLPTPMWKAASAKLLMASLAATLPILFLMAVSYGCCRIGVFYFDSMNPHAVPGWFFRCTVTAVLVTLSLLWWTSAIGVNRSDEIRAGAIAFLVSVAIWFCLGYLLHLSDKHHLPTIEKGLAIAASAAPGGPMWWQSYAERLEPRRRSIPQLPGFGLSYPVLALVGHAGVLGWFLCRFGRVSTKTGRGDKLQSKTAKVGGLKAPFKSQLTAIAWKQMRETGPLAVLALPAILAMSGFVVWVTPHEQLSFSLIFLQAGASMSFFVVLVAGIGLYLDELKPGLNHFWRSRPNDFRLWFGVKYVAGLLVLVTALGIPLFLAGMSQWSETYNPEQRELWVGILFGVWFFVITYSLAMTFQCLVRQPIYAVVLTLTAMWLGPFVFYQVFANTPPASVTVTAMVLSLMGVIALAWKTVKHDWGWKR